jgi:hypothetical protein
VFSDNSSAITYRQGIALSAQRHREASAVFIAEEVVDSAGLTERTSTPDAFHSKNEIKQKNKNRKTEKEEQIEKAKNKDKMNGIRIGRRSVLSVIVL